MINVENQNVFLDEKNKRKAFIKFVSDDTYINADQIVDQASFKYTESSNDGDVIKLGFSESSSFEIDVKGDWSERAGEEIYVEIQAITEDENEIKIYPIPIGFFIVTDIDYDYKLDISHLLAYNKIALGGESPSVELPSRPPQTGFYTSTAYFLDRVVNDGELKKYYEITEPITVQKVLLLDQTKTDDYWRDAYDTDGAHRWFHYQEKRTYDVCEYRLDNNYSVLSGGYLRLIFELVCPYSTYATSQENWGLYDESVTKVKNFLKENPLYDSLYVQHHEGYDSYQVNYPYSKTYIGTNWYYHYPDNATYYTDKTLSLNLMPNYENFVIASKYYKAYDIRYEKYTYTAPNDYRALSSSASRYARNSVPSATADSFADIVVKYIKTLQYGIFNNLVGSSSLNSAYNKYNGEEQKKILSDYAEVQGKIVRMNRVDGSFDYYDLSSTNAIYPSDDIYPNEGIYPQGDKNTIKISKSMYAELISKTKRSKKVGKVIAYKNSGSTKAEYVAQVSDFNEEKYSTITLSEDNYIIDGGFIEPQTVVDNILAMYSTDLYTPFELECTGLPWLEAGDWIIVETDDGQQRLNVNRRTLSGIQGMMDSLSAGGI